MNNKLFKVIFNKRLGKMDVVSEITTTNGKAASESTATSGTSFLALMFKPMAWALLVSTGNFAVMQTAYGQIVADKNAPTSQQAIILNTASGATQANISTPTAAGVSMNQYSQFNVNNPLILNNSRTSVSTQTAGFIQGNPYLATGSAKIIVNQVNGSVANLNNSIEIAGPRSELVIAAPNGIIANGSTIINASSTTLTTGTPVINAGNLEAYRVTQGQITVDGTGLDTSQSDYTKIIAQSVKANAGIWAKDLSVTAGSNQVNVDGSHTKITGTAPAPTYALDSSSLGGMYAGKITFIGTDTGVGINNAGQIAASAGQVSIDANGLLTNSGTINSNGQANATTVKTTAVHNSGTISAQGNTQIQTSQETQNSGTITSGVELKVNASDIDNSNGTLNGQRVELNANSLNNTKGTIAQTGSQALALNAGNINNANGGLIGYAPLDTSGGTGGTGTGTGGTGTGTGGTTTPTPTPPSTADGGGTSTVVQPTPVVLADGVINITNTINNDAGQITANGGIDLTSTNGLTNHGTLSLNKLKVTGDTLDNTSGTITTSELTANTNSINNTSGKLGSTGNIDLIANSLTNSSGQITASGTASANIAGVVLNDNGTLASNGALTVTANSVNNTKGTLASINDSANITSAQALNNTTGNIQSAKALNVKALGVNNTDGKIIGGAVSVNSQAQTLNNLRGSIAGTSVALNTGALNNDAGLIQGEESVQVNTNGQTLTNINSGSTKGLISAGTLDVQSGDLDNNAGYVSSKGKATIHSAQINNTTAGQITSEADLDVSASGLDNRGGQITTAGNTRIAVGAGTINNDSSLIRADGTITLNAGHLINTNTNATDKGIEGTNLAITSNDIDNTSGALRADDSITVQSSGTLNNTSGLISALKTVDIKDPSASKALAITNTNGTVIAGEQSTLNAKSITGDGKLLSNGKLAVTLVDDFTNNATVQAATDLSLSTAGTLTNNAKLLSGGQNNLSAQNLNNTVTGEIIGGTTHVHANDTVTNRGLIDGTATKVTASTVTNIGTGRIYGDHVAIGATTLNNLDETVGGVNKAATIAARDSGMDIGVTHLNNLEHSLITSAGNLHIGGALGANDIATGKADSVLNGSATIESATDMSIAANQLSNLNLHLSTSVHTVDVQNVSNIQFSNRSSGEHGPGDYGWNLGDMFPGVYDPAAYYRTYEDGHLGYLHQIDSQGQDINLGRIWIDNNYTETTQQTQVDATDPSKITAGGSMTFDGNVLNKDSTIIAGGAISQLSGSLINESAQGTTIVTKVGTSINRDWHHEGGWGGGYSNDDITTPINSTISTSFELPTTVYTPNATPSSSGIDIGSKSSSSLSDTAAGGNSANASTSIMSTNTTDPTLIKTGAINTSIPNSSLFSVNPNSSGYLIQTDPQYASYRNWLSSDYMLESLKLDPATMHKRLGDGYYEQKLIREQIAQLTGRRYLDGQTNDDDQYKKLMTSAVTFAGQYNLRPGIALTAEQMAHLTSDIVWLVEQEVTLPDGTKTTALVPKVYVAVRPGDLQGNGALISGSSIDLKLTGDLNNSGTIAGRKVTQISARNINNLGGLIDGNQVDLSATQDLNNIGGIINAQTSAALRAGRDVNIASTTATGTGQSGSSSTIIDRIAGIYVGDGSKDKDSASLLIKAGNNANLTGADIANDGQGLTAISGTNVNLNTVKVGETDNKVWDEQNFRKQTTSTDVGTSINGVGGILLKATNDVNLTAASVNSETGLTELNAGRDVNIKSGQSTDTYQDASHSTNSGLLSSSEHTQRSTHDTVTQIGSEVTGDKVLIKATNDVNVIASSVVSDTGTQIDAGHDVNILDAANTSQAAGFRETKASGIMGGGGASLFIGSKMNSTDSASTSSESVGSSVGSLHGNTNITAGNHYQQTGSTVSSPEGDINIKAKSVDIAASANTATSDTVDKSQTKGVTIAVSAPVVDAIMAVKNAADTVGKSKNARVNAMAAANTAWDAYKAVDAVGDAANNLAKGADGTLVNVSITYGQQKTETQTHASSSTAVASTVKAGGQVNIQATGGGDASNINIKGSDVYGGTGTALKADNQINLTAAQSTAEEHTSNKSSGFNAGVAIAVSTSGLSAGITAGGNIGKGHGDGESVTQRNTHVGSGGTTSLTSGGTTTLSGAQVTGNRVEVDAAALKIESLQDTNTYDSKQMNASAQVTVGYGFSASGSYSQSKTDANYASVAEQSGIIAGDGGYKVKVKGNTDLTGGIITSTQVAEDAGLNSFSTGTLTSKDIQNHADYKGSGFGLSASGGVNGSDKKAEGSNWTSQGGTGTGKASLTASKSIGYASDSDHDKSVTNSGINTKNITITDEAGQAATGQTSEQIKSIVATDTVKETVLANSGAIANNFDKQAVQAELDVQLQVTQEFDKNRQAARAEINTAIDGKQKELDALKAKGKTADDPEVARLSGEISNMQKGGVLLDMVAGGLSGPNTNGLVGTLAKTLAPAVSYEIGQHFKTTGGEGSTDHLLAHTLLAAAVAAASGGNALSAGLSAGGGEALTPKLAQYLYGTSDSSKLTAEQKSTLSAIVGLGGAAVGGAIGGGADAVASSTAAQNAVDNNHLTRAKVQQYVDMSIACGRGAGYGCNVRDSIFAEAQWNKDQLKLLSAKRSGFTRKEAAYIVEMYNNYTDMGRYFENVTDKGLDSGASEVDIQNLQKVMLDYSQVNITGLYIQAMSEHNGLQVAGARLALEGGSGYGSGRGRVKTAKQEALSNVKNYDGAPPQFAKTLASNPNQIWGLTPNEIADGFKAAGYNVTVRPGKGRSDTTVIVVNGHPEISQIQVTNSSVSHRDDYYKISTTTVGKYKVVGPNYSQRGVDPEKNTTFIGGR